jgi:hypothetical protein
MHDSGMHQRSVSRVCCLLERKDDARREVFLRNHDHFTDRKLIMRHLGFRCKQLPLTFQIKSHQTENRSERTPVCNFLVLILAPDKKRGHFGFDICDCAMHEKQRH